MKSIPKIIICGVAVLTLSCLFLLNLPIRKEGFPGSVVPLTSKKSLLELEYGSSENKTTKSIPIDQKVAELKLELAEFRSNVMHFVIKNKTTVYVHGWSMNTTRNASQYIFVNNTNANIMPDRLCDKPTLIMAMVCSAPDNFEARQAIRDTWGSTESQLANNMSVNFLIGETENVTVQSDLYAEQERNGDIIQERFIDSYNNLTLKTIQMIKISTNHCSNTTKFLLKIDDDMFLNVANLLTMLREKNANERFVIGKLICGAKPIKNPKSKWYAPQYMFEGKVYPNYLSGTGYLMSMDVARKLFDVTLKTPIFHLEDVYLTGICLSKTQIRAQNDNRFTYQQMKERKCRNMDYITMHHFNPKLMRETFRAFNNPKVIETCRKARQQHSINNSTNGINNGTSTWLSDSFKPNNINRMTRKNKCA